MEGIYMPIRPATFFDTFNRTRTDVWGSADSGQSWQGTNANYDVNGAAGTITVSSSMAPNVNFLSRSANNVETLMLSRWTSGLAEPLTDWGPALNRTASNNYYAVSIQDYYDEVAIIFYQNGV